MAALFIVLEGIDGSGKTTQGDRLLAYFHNKEIPAVLSPEPTNGPVGSLIRQALQGNLFAYNDPQQFEAQMGYLFAADRHYHLYNPVDGVRAKLAQQCHVITTRYYFSSLAYNCHTEADWQFVQRLNESFPQPDCVIYLDLPVDLALQRLGDRQQLSNQAPRECYEQREKLINVHRNYGRIFDHYQGQLCRLDASLSVEQLHQAIITKVEEML
ncbi:MULTISPECIES: dTMP kinase [unclassified Synechocystis]|uniref:dTMP kinase n=1 Tax=unclassified Synechocystis TaxID=2640012 RepID=UPI00041DEBAA|nr:MULTISPECIES: dTMP kinase [unclassified Synechocystis]AIE72939.1 Thymidylate kinase [Synechocystis sp. PCC 6714]